MCLYVAIDLRSRSPICTLWQRSAAVNWRVCFVHFLLRKSTLKTLTHTLSVCFVIALLAQFRKRRRRSKTKQKVVFPLESSAEWEIQGALENLPVWKKLWLAYFSFIITTTRCTLLFFSILLLIHYLLTHLFSRKKSVVSLIKMNGGLLLSCPVLLSKSRKKMMMKCHLTSATHLKVITGDCCNSRVEFIANSSISSSSYF